MMYFADDPGTSNMSLDRIGITNVNTGVNVIFKLTNFESSNNTLMLL